MTRRHPTVRRTQAPGFDSAALEAGLAPWLAALLERARAADPGSFEHAVGAGLLGRLWTPASPVRSSTEAARLASLLRFEPPGLVARAWFAGLPPRRRAALAAEACRRARDLATALARLGRSRIRASTPRARLLLDCLHQRDDLECIASLLGSRRAGSPLARALLDLDRFARGAVAPCAGALCQDPRLRAVGWQEPERWWGRLAEP